MSKIFARDGAEIFYKDWGVGPAVVLSHGWPLSADVWDDQLLHLSQKGFRAVAHDRRGHGRSSQTSGGNDMDTYADDLASLLDALDLHDVVLVGHSTGGGEVTRYLGRHGSARVRGLVLVSAIPPLMRRTPTNPAGTPIEAFDQLRAAMLRDRSQFYRDLSEPFYGANREGAQVSQGIRDQFWRLSMQVGFKAAYECVAVFSETDLTQDLARIDVPTLIIHGDDDQIVPIGASALLSSKQIRQATLKIYEGAPHGLTATHKDRFHADLLAFLTSELRTPSGTRRNGPEARPALA